MNKSIRDTDPIHIAISTDANYLEHAAATITSIFCNMAVDDYCVVYVLRTKDLDCSWFDGLKNIKNGQCDIKYVDIDLSLFAKFPEKNYFTVAAYFRLALHLLLPDVSKLLYLDIDLLVRCSLRELWDTDLTGSLAGVVESPSREKFGSKKFYNLPAAHKSIGIKSGTCFNSGVMLMNLDLLRAENIWVEYMEAFEEFGDRIQFADQDILNHVYSNRVKYVGFKWNVGLHGYLCWPLYDEYDDVEVIAGCKSPGIAHFFGPRKPWTWEHVRHPFSLEYWAYRKKAGVKGLQWRYLYKKHTQWLRPCKRKSIYKIMGRK
jgi:lipopolysaccharide biosynthesis glycosyltransferase